ncbi:putative quinol monooxygenase [Phyllobacterium sp. CCNWLW109]|uniref:putative quinol monooxygenase n=1 Tax=Phyllobacterium sp. CCNWLW109 TaxID=3127479 RepID=UPI0030780B1A
MSRTPFNFIANFKAVGGREKELEEILKTMVAPTRAEDGCINYDLHVHADDPTRFVLYEGWKSPEALDLHMKMPHFLEMLKGLDGVVAEKDENGRPFRATALAMISDRS